MRHTKLLLALILACTCIGRGYANDSSSVAAPSPNIVVIFMDDMGYGDLECYGGFPYHTPNINKLAASGMRFTNFYAAQGVCSASRAGLLTGNYPNRIGISGAFDHLSKKALSPDEETIADLLKAKGYKTGMVGKWHLGQRPPFFPLQHGFDEWLGLPYSNDMWPVHYDGKPLDTSTYRGRYPLLPLIDGNKTVRIIRTLDDQAQLTTLYTERAVEFITKNRNNPFFLYMAHSMPHVPIAASEKFRGKSVVGLFGDVIEEIDWSVGEVMKTLDKYKLSNNTLVIFTSDNGPWLTYGNHAGNTGGLREGKGTAWEGGVRVPCIMRWPGRIPAASICNRLSSTIDLLPTVADICVARLPAKKIDGVNIRLLLEGDASANPRDEFAYYYDENSLKAVRKGQYKLVFPATSRSYKSAANIGSDGFPGEYSVVDVPFALYDLRSDPGEAIDVKESHKEVVEALQLIADKYRRMLGDDLTHTIGSENRAPGRVE